MNISREQIQDKINAEKFKALQDLKQVELRLFENCKTDFMKWLELTEFLEKLKEAEHELVHDSQQEMIDLELKSNFELFVEKIIATNFKDEFQSIFTDYVDDEVEKALEKFLANKGLMGVMIHLRNHMDAETNKLRFKLFKDFEDWNFQTKPNRAAKESMKQSMNFLQVVKEIEYLAQKRLDKITEEFVESLDNKSLQEATTSIQLSETLIQSVMQFVFNEIERKLNVMMEEYKTVSQILQENIKKKILEEN
ncbi:hypothetical protein [Bernardetia sp.]|uniref:hypothetical protein n=1 Tax=Bernardetia sp. TaxID=1937974 RepID=UPI0025BD6DAC|nr:hypothetical protein [Bernardetia sp.]